MGNTAAVAAPEKTYAISVKGVKEIQTFDAPAFEASLYIDGIAVGRAFNGGHGGDNEYVINPKYEQLFEDASVWARTLEEESDLGAEPVMLQKSMDWLIDEAINDFNVLKQARRLMKKCAVFFEKSTGELVSYPRLSVTMADAKARDINMRHAEKLAKKDGTVFLNPSFTDKELLEILRGKMDHRG